MKVRGSGKDSEKIEPQMAPMIDVVFQLLIFFMLTLKIIEPEGDFSVNMPIGAPSQSTSPDINLPDIKVRLEANPDGTLKNIRIGQLSLGANDGSFDQLNNEVLKIIGRPGNPLTKDIEVELDADYNLHYENIIKAVGACTGRVGPDGNIVRYVEKIKFAKPRRPT